MSEPKIILLVDDEPMNLKVLNTVLSERYKTKVATNGDKALMIAQRAPKPDLILLDVMMPGMDGYQVCERLKSSAETSDIPVVFLSGKTAESDRSKGLALGAVDFLPKPIDVAQVLECVSACFSK